ncbi:ABC transporter ATP-binding protein [Leptolyngbya iicbica LK]|uniref:Spermidine/putrescine import ATP-binding protein PotA n=3 Tax=Cyanophyceae TaxID=3028117 RepID=A0A4Q7E9X8_9CYAN|nr:ABC transporter ATP-binding protein [Leptolyngbya sp. LK]
MSQTVSPAMSQSSNQRVADVELCQVSKSFGEEIAVNTIDLTIQEGEFFSILGPSGCGKTTTLRLIAGFEQPTTGKVVIQGRDMNRTPAHRRSVNTVFQSYALFNHMTVKDNIAFGLRIKKMGRSQVQQRVTDALRLVKMEAFGNRYPAQLSGGQKQRVALARALVNRPAVMLLDEPLGALDLKLRKEMQVELSNLHQQLGITFVMVTHDQEEALSLSDRIAVMNDGNIEQIGSPKEIYDHPTTPFVADFIGDTNLLKGTVAFADKHMLQIKTPEGTTVLAQPSDNIPADLKTAVVSVRPEKIHLSQEPPPDEGNCYSGYVKHVMYLGTHLHCVVQLQTGECLTVMQPNRTGLSWASATPVYVSWMPADCLALAA